MNWYKKAQQLEVVDAKDLKGKGRHYTGFAHDINYGERNRMLGFDPNENYSIDNPNVLWVYNNGQIETKPETKMNQTHRSKGNWDLNSNLDRLYTGRYSPSENIITLIPPHEGIGRYRDIPEQLKFLLKQTFPQAVQIYNYARSNSWYKKAQINEGKVKLMPFEQVALLGKNTKRNEGPWRISHLSHGRPAWHIDYDTYEEALLEFNMLPERDKNIGYNTQEEDDILMRMSNELV